MATQGTSEDFGKLLMAMSDAGAVIVPKGKLLVIFDPPNTSGHAIGLILDNPVNGGMDAPLG